MESSLKEREGEIANRLMKEYFLIPETLNNAGFKDYRETNNVTARAKSNFIRFVKDFQDDKRYNLLVMGNPGTGKTHLCVAVARTLKEKGFTVGFITTGKLLSIIKETYQKGAAKTEERFLET